jgi:hypothetical protein
MPSDRLYYNNNMDKTSSSPKDKAHNLSSVNRQSDIPWIYYFHGDSMGCG